MVRETCKSNAERLKGVERALEVQMKAVPISLSELAKRICGFLQNRRGSVTTMAFNDVGCSKELLYPFVYDLEVLDRRDCDATVKV